MKVPVFTLLIQQKGIHISKVVEFLPFVPVFSLFDVVGVIFAVGKILDSSGFCVVVFVVGEVLECSRIFVAPIIVG
jgi:hypothetical protein